MAELESLTLIPDVLNQEIQVQFGLKLKIPMGLIRLNENTKLKSSCSSTGQHKDCKDNHGVQFGSLEQGQRLWLNLNTYYFCSVSTT